MLANKNQVATTKKKISQLMEAKASITKDDFLSLRMKDDYQNLINELQTEIDEFEGLYGRGIEGITIACLDDVGKVPRRIRLGLKLSREEFAQRLEMEHRTIVRWESSDYCKVKLDDLKAIFRKFGLEFAEPSALVVKRPPDTQRDRA